MACYMADSLALGLSVEQSNLYLVLFPTSSTIISGQPRHDSYFLEDCALTSMSFGFGPQYYRVGNIVVSKPHPLEV